MRWVILLRRRQLAALVRYRVLQALMIRLRQDRCDGNIARVRRQHCVACRIEGAEHLCRREGQLQHVEARLLVLGPHEAPHGTTKCRQLHRELGVALHEAAVVVGEPCEAPHLRA